MQIAVSYKIGTFRLIPTTLQLKRRDGKGTHIYRVVEAALRQWPHAHHAFTKSNTLLKGRASLF
jgi:hypothetical protein